MCHHTPACLWPTPGPVPQMKKRYSSAKPYGEWLAQEVVTVEQIARSVPDKVLIPPPIREATPAFDATATNGNGNGAPTKGVSRLIKPLKAFGYTVGWIAGSLAWLWAPCLDQ